jgi:hypothetical protein
VALLFAGSVAYQGMVVMPRQDENTRRNEEAAASILADRADESQRLRLLEEARKRQVVNEATLLLRQEQNLRAAESVTKALRGD